MNRTLCAIPARIGSKRIPRKNIRLLAGKPLIAYSIETAVNSGLFESIYVCTDDMEIAKVAREYGAEVPFLMSPDLCDDLIPSHIPCQHLAEKLIEQGQKLDTLVCLQPTSPLRSTNDIHAAVERFAQEDINFLVSVTPIDPHFFHWSVEPKNNKNLREKWQLYFGEKWLIERNLLPPMYRPNGSIKIANLKKLKEVNHFFGKSLGTIETPEERSVHIGTQLDWDFCEFLLKQPS